jgi:hypothetical protein
MDLGVTPTGDQSTRPDATPPLVTIEPKAQDGPPKPSQKGTGRDVHVDVVPPRVGQPGYEDKAPVVLWVPGRAGLNKTEQAALDRYVQRMQRKGGLTPALKAELRGASADALRTKLRKEIDRQPGIQARRDAAEAAQKTNVPDPRQAGFDRERDEGGGVTARWNGADDQRPSEREIGEAKVVAAATEEPVVLYGNNFAGVDGTIGNPPRLLQLKSAPDAATLTTVIATAKQNAQRHGDRGLEVHVVAQGLTMDQAMAELQRNPVTFGAWLGRVVVHVQGGFIPLHSSGRPGGGDGGGGSGQGGPPSGTPGPVRPAPGKPPAPPPPAPTPEPEPAPSERLAKRVGRLRSKRAERQGELTALQGEETTARQARAAKYRQVTGTRDKAKREALQRELDQLDEELADIEAARITKQQQVDMIDRALTRELHPLPREADDVAVSGGTPRDALDPAGRTIGKTPNQQAELEADVAWAIGQGAKDVRVNQQQVDADEKVQGTNRPDLQYTLNGRRYYIEYEQPGNPRGWEHARRIIPNDPRGVLVVKLVPTAAGFRPGQGVRRVEYDYDFVARRLGVR